MKKMMILLLCMVLACGAALAEAGSFSFRNGVVWGMTQEEVVAAEGSQEYDTFEVSAKMAGIEYDDVVTSGVEAELNYLFINGALMIAGYEYDDEDIDILTLSQTLDAKYGAHEQADVDRLVALMKAYRPDNADYAELFSDEDSASITWTLPDGTYILLTDAYGDIQLAYFDEAAILASANASVSEPAPALDPSDF